MSDFPTLREACCAANVRLSTLGLVDLTFGNVSVVDREAGVFAIKPSGVDYAALQPEDMVVLDLKTGGVVAGTRRPSSDAPTYRRLLQAFASARAVVHTHSRQAVAFAQAGRGIPCLGTTHADSFCGETPVTRALTDAEISSDCKWATGEVIVECFETLGPAEIPAVLVRGHGPFAWGPTADKALENAFVMEVVAGMALQTLALNPAAAPLPEALREKHFRRKHGPSAYYGQPG